MTTRVHKTMAVPAAPRASILTFWLMFVPAKGLQGGGTPWRCRTCSTCLTTASWQNLRCSCRDTWPGELGEAPVATGRPPVPAPGPSPSPAACVSSAAACAAPAGTALGACSRPPPPARLRRAVRRLLCAPPRSCGRRGVLRPRAPGGRALWQLPLLRTLPAVHDNGCVQGSLVQVVRVHLLDEAQQVAGAVRQASAGQGL